jgi:hypothetical protein
VACKSVTRLTEKRVTLDAQGIEIMEVECKNTGTIRNHADRFARANTR